jgi:hypothetical protein
MTTQRLLTIALIILICLLLIVWPRAARAESTCPTPMNVTLARLDVLSEHIVLDGSERIRLIDVNDQAFAAAQGNVAGLQYQEATESKDGKAHWLINGVQIAPNWKHHYSITYMGEGRFGNLQPIGDTRFVSLDAYPDVYFWFTFPVDVMGIETVGDIQQYAVYWSEHPTCSPQGSYGSAVRATVDELLKPRK